MSGIKRLPVAWIVLSLLLGVLLGVGGYTFNEARGWSYLSNDPLTCVNCHIMREQYDGWQKAAHHAVAVCNDCHVPHDLVGKWTVKAENGYRHSKAFTLQNFHEPIQMRDKSQRVLLDNCVRCHREMVDNIVSQAGHAGESADCLHCHRSAGHGPTE